MYVHYAHITVENILKLYVPNIQDNLQYKYKSGNMCLTSREVLTVNEQIEQYSQSRNFLP